MKKSKFKIWVDPETPLSKEEKKAAKERKKKEKIEKNLNKLAKKRQSEARRQLNLPVCEKESACDKMPGAVQCPTEEVECIYK